MSFFFLFPPSLSFSLSRPMVLPPVLPRDVGCRREPPPHRDVSTHLACYRLLETGNKAQIAELTSASSRNGEQSPRRTALTSPGSPSRSSADRDDHRRHSPPPELASKLARMKRRGGRATPFACDPARHDPARPGCSNQRMGAYTTRGDSIRFQALPKFRFGEGKSSVVCELF